jgi:RimJ/RimL family protein N-acetyltransferase
MDAALEIPRCLRVRSLRQGERRAVAQVFVGLGERSRRLRFGGPKPRLADGELTWLADVDGTTHTAVVAVDCDGYAVGIARFVRESAAATSAEVAFAVVDAWQGRGIGSRLVDALAERARDAGVERFTALVAAGNEASLRLLRRAGEVVSSRVVDGDWEVAVALRPRELRRAA